MAFDFDDLEEQDPTELLKGPPVFCAWYSGGFTKEDGQALVSQLIGSIRQEYRQVDTLVLHFPNEYGMIEEGSDPWPKYVDRLIEEIDSDPKRAGRPLLLFGHSRGNAPAMTVASRLKDRVLRVYIAASSAPVHGQPSPFQTLSEGFKQSGDIGLLAWFYSLQPENMMLKSMLEEVHKGTPVEDMPFLNKMLTLMRQQYKDAMWPDMERDFSGVTAPITAFGPRLDAGCSREGMEGWKSWTSCPERSKVKMISGATHMGCVTKTLLDGVESCVLIDEILRDIGAILKAC